MKKGLFLLIFTVPCFAEGPQYRHQDKTTNLEFQNVYQDLRSVDSTVTQSILSSTNTWTGINLFTSSTSIYGTRTNDDACSGCVGQWISSTTSFFIHSATDGPSGIYVDRATITLTAGDWLISGQGFVDRGTSTWTGYGIAISSTAGSGAQGIFRGDNRLDDEWASSVTTPGGQSMTIASYRRSIATTTNFFLKTYILYSAGFPNFRGRISAHRIR